MIGMMMLWISYGFYRINRTMGKEGERTHALGIAGIVGEILIFRQLILNSECNARPARAAPLLFPLFI
jgi:hypothetical protein